MAKKRRQQQQQQQQRQASAAAASAPPKVSEDVNDSDDEEIDEDEAFNSDDERKYGMFFHQDEDDKKPSAKKKSSNGDNDGDDDDESEGGDDDNDESDDDDSDGDESDDDDDDEGDGGQYMLDLLDKLGNDSGKKSDHDENKQYPQMVAHVKESAYSSSVVPSAGLTMDALMQDLKDTKGFGALAKTMKVVVSKTSASTTNGGGPTLAPLPRVQSDRLQRQIGYSKTSDKMTREWIETVQENRKAETLDFRGHLQQEIANKITATTLVETFTPTTDFEKEIHDALQQAGQLEEEAILQAEQEAIMKQHDDLGDAEMTLEDLAQRRAQLAKMRALMFYHEQKRHHMNKIKSKKYRRIRKRQAERLKQADLDAQVEQNPDLEHELQEKEHVERMKERMTLAHKNTSKWAKRILKRSKKGGASVDVDTRRALSAQLKRGDDLLQKMKTRNDNDGDSSNDDDDDDEDLVETARKVLAEAENDDDDEADTSNRPGLFKMSFMQRGIEKQKQQAREEARQLLEELEADRELEQQASGSDDNDDDDNNKESTKLQAGKSKAAPAVASRQELKDILKEGGEMTTSRSASSAIAVSGNIQIDLGDNDDGDNNDDNDSDDDEDGRAKKQEPLSLRSEHTSMLESTGTASSSNSPPPPLKGAAKSLQAKHASSSRQQELHKHQTKDNENVNPWLMAVADNDPNQNKKNSDKKSKKSPGNKNMVDVDRAVDLLEPHSISTLKVAPATCAESTKRKGSSGAAEDNDHKEHPEEHQKKITHLSQEELVRRAFASSAQDADDDFAREKALVEEREDPLYKKKLADQKSASCKGWGSWAGKGAAAAPPPPLPGKKALPRHLQPPAKKKQKTNNDNSNNMDPDKRKRRDGGKDHLIIRERRVKRMADQYMLHQVPYPYSCRQEYERAMAGGIGPEWNVTQSVKDLTRPEICSRAGKIIEPLSLQAKKMSKKRKNPVSAKF